MFTFIFARIFKRVLESLTMASSLSVLGLEAACPCQLGPWPRTFLESLALKVVSLTSPLFLSVAQGKKIRWQANEFFNVEFMMCKAELCYNHLTLEQQLLKTFFSKSLWFKFLFKITILTYGTAKCVDTPPTAGAQECIPPLIPLCYVTGRKYIRLTLYAVE